MAEHAEEAKTMAKTTKQKEKESQFLLQKSEEYKKVIASLEVCA